MIAISRKNNSFDVERNTKNDIVKEKIDDEIERLQYQRNKEYFPAISKNHFTKVKYVDGKQVTISDHYGLISEHLLFYN
jgi:hypothetical protein